MASWEIKLHDKTSGKNLIIKTDGSAINEDRTYILPDTGGNLLTQEHLADPANFPAAFLTAIRGTQGVGISGITWIATTDISNHQGVAGATDTYRIGLSDGSSSQFTVTNGQTVGALDTMINSALSALVGSAPASLNTLQELAAAINNNADFYNTIIQAIALKADAGTVYTKTQVDAFVASLKTIPQISKSVAYTLALSDGGNGIDTSAGIVIPLASAVNFPIGAIITITNMSAADITIIPTVGVTLRQAGTTNVGDRAMSSYGVCTLRKVATDTWIVAGAGVK